MPLCGGAGISSGVGSVCHRPWTVAGLLDRTRSPRTPRTPHPAGTHAGFPARNSTLHSKLLWRPPTAPRPSRITSRTGSRRANQLPLPVPHSQCPMPNPLQCGTPCVTFITTLRRYHRHPLFSSSRHPFLRPREHAVPTSAKPPPSPPPPPPAAALYAEGAITIRWPSSSASASAKCACG